MSGLFGIPTQRRLKKIDEIQIIDLITYISQIALINEISEIKKVRGLHWFDRNPTPINRSWSGSAVAPHSPTVRWTYTVPANKIAFLELAFAHVLRRSASTVLGEVACEFFYTPNGGSTLPTLRALIFDNTVGARAHVNVGQALIMNEGDLLEGMSYDDSNGGTTIMEVNAKLTEFDL